MKLTVDDIRAVVAVADRGSFKKAADALGLTQPALSRRIAKTEEILNAALFERTTQHVNLSPIGQAFVFRARTILNDFDRFDLELKSMASGTNPVIELSSLRTVAASIMPRLVRNFRDEFGRVRFHIREDSGIRAIERVADRDVEFGISIAIPRGPDLDFEPLVRDPFILSCAPDHHLYKKDNAPLEWRSLIREEVSFLGGAAANQLLLSSILSKEGIDITWSDEIEFLSTHMGFVDEGIVAAVLPRLGLAFSKNRSLCARPLVEPRVEREIGIFTRPNWKPSTATASFIAFIRKNLADEYARVTQGWHPSQLAMAKGAGSSE